MSYVYDTLTEIRKVQDKLKTIYAFVNTIQIQWMTTQDKICECYCKFPDEYRSMYKDVDEAQENLEREKCDMCPLNKLI